MSKSVSSNQSKDRNKAQVEHRSPEMPQLGTPGPAVGLWSLQRAAGNLATEGLLRSTGDASRTIQLKHLSCETPEDLPAPCADTKGNSDEQAALLEDVQAKLTVSQPGDRYEQEADRVADQVMRMPDAALEIGSQSFAGIQRKCAECNSGGKTCPKCEEEKIHRSSWSSTPSILLQRQAKSASRPTPGKGSPPSDGSRRSSEVPSAIGARIQSARSGGLPLPVKTRAFFESRFRLDLSGVRVHRDREASETATALRARAFTIGRDIVFGTGQYSPETDAGKRLLAHELTHVVQQTRPANLITPKSEMIPGYADSHAVQPRQTAPQSLIQCDKIDHRDLTWEDFKGKVPKKTTFEAGTFSGLRDLDLSKIDASNIDTEDTGTPCKIGKKDSSIFKATITLDPDDIEVKAYMDQDLSWAKPWTKDNTEREKLCKKNFVKPCETSFKAQHKKIAKQVKKEVKNCEKQAKKSVPLTFTLDGEEIEINAPGDCAADFGPKLEESLKKQLKWTGKLAGEEAEATTLADCSTTLLQECIDRLYQAESDRLLKHEQGHFDISNAIAEKATDTLRTMLGGFKTEFQACGDEKALGKAKAALKGYSKKLKKSYGTSKSGLNKIQNKYDAQTAHGTKEKQQAKWEEKIAEGL